MFTIVFQREYVSILYQKYVINGKKLQYFGYGAKCCCFYFSFLIDFLMKVLVIFVVCLFSRSSRLRRGKSRPAAYQITRTQ